MSIKWTKELLEECRNERGVVFGMMSEAAQCALQEVRNIHDSVETWSSFCNGWTNFGHGTCEKFRAFRLRHDWTPPELKGKQWVDVPVRESSDGIYLYTITLENEKQIVSALSQPNFMGFVYADGMVTVFPRRDSFDCGIAMAPVAVRFWTGSEAAK